MRKAHSKLSSLGRWLWQRRRWAVALAAAVLAGILVFDPTVRFYIYEHVRPRSRCFQDQGMNGAFWWVPIGGYIVPIISMKIFRILLYEYARGADYGKSTCLIE